MTDKAWLGVKSQSLTSLFKTGTWKSRKHVCKGRHLASGFSVYVTSWARLECVAAVYMCHEPSFFCSLLVKSESAWLHPEQLQLQPKKYFCCINIDRTTKQSQQPVEAKNQLKPTTKWSLKTEIMCTFSVFSGALASSLGIPIKRKFSSKKEKKKKDSDVATARLPCILSSEFPAALLYRGSTVLSR